jgi:hypothetical protein
MDELCRMFVGDGLKNKIPSSAENRILIFHFMTFYFINSLCGSIKPEKLHNFIIIERQSDLESVSAYRRPKYGIIYVLTALNLKILTSGSRRRAISEVLNFQRPLTRSVFRLN